MHQAILGTCDLWSGSPAAALANFIRAEEMADARGWSEPAMRLWRADHAEALLQLGRVEDAALLIADWEQAATRLGRDRVLVDALRCRGQISAARGDLPTASDLLERAVGRSEAADEPFGRARAFLALGVVRLRARQKRTARQALEAALAGFEALGASGWAATARTELARVGGRERIEGLNPSEIRVADLVAEGRTNREIASALFLGERTVASHLTHVYAKLGVRSRTELARHLHPPAKEAGGNSGNVPTS
jgi:DNA-binding CsgD family transcriptional regulator